MKQVHEVAPAKSLPLLYWCAGLSVGALLAHAIDAPDHLREWWGYSTFFVVVGAFQLFYGFLLLLQPWRYDDTGSPRPDALRHGRPYFMLGVVLAAAVPVVYAVSRTTGLPFLGPQAAAEPVTVLGLLPVVEDAVLLFMLVRLYRRAGRA